MAAPTVDEITLSMPRDRAYHGVAQLVLSGLATRRPVTFEGLEDLSIALESLLARREAAAFVTITLRLAETEIETLVGPFGKEVGAELTREPGDEVGLRRILEAVSDRVDLVDEKDGQWVRLTKLLDVSGRAA